MRLSAALTALAAVAAGAVVALAYGLTGGLQTAGLLAASGVAGLVLAHAAAGRRRALALRSQYAVAVALALGTVLVATVAGGLLMFVSDHDVVIILVVTVFAAAIAARAAALLSEGMVARLVAEETRAAAADRARRDLVAGASHDLRTPVAALGLLVQALEDDIVDEPTRRRYLRTMQTHVGALGSLIDDLFELTRIEAGEIAWSLHQVFLGELLSETVEALEPAARLRGVELRSEVSDASLAAHADPDKLRRVLFNLVHNAIAHTPADGSVRLLAQSGSDGPEIEVADTGAGISDADQARVFEPFFRAGADAARSGDGAGLGLAISRAIVEAHGGQIWIEPGRPGTRVRLTLPAAL